MDRLTGRTEEEITAVAETVAVGDLTFNELLALAGRKLAELEGTLEMIPSERRRDAGRDISVAFTALEDALTRHNSAHYRIGGTWVRADPEHVA